MGWGEVDQTIAESSEECGLLADALTARPPNALERAVVSDFLERRESELASHCVGLAVAVGNPVVRAAATAVFWVVSPPMPVSFHLSLEEARAWLQGRFREVGAA